MDSGFEIDSDDLDSEGFLRRELAEQAARD